MAFRITDTCQGCGGCKIICPSEAISGRPDERHTINPGKCFECGTCARACTRQAIVDAHGQPYRSRIIRQDLREDRKD